MADTYSDEDFEEVDPSKTHQRKGKGTFEEDHADDDYDDDEFEKTGTLKGTNGAAKKKADDDFDDSLPDKKLTSTAGKGKGTTSGGGAGTKTTTSSAKKPAGSDDDDYSDDDFSSSPKADKKASKAAGSNGKAQSRGNHRAGQSVDGTSEGASSSSPSKSGGDHKRFQSTGTESRNGKSKQGKTSSRSVNRKNSTSAQVRSNTGTRQTKDKQAMKVNVPLTANYGLLDKMAPVKQMSYLKKENLDLRNELLRLNNHLNDLLEQQALKKPKLPARETDHVRTAENEVRNNEKILKLSQTEHTKLKKRLDQVSDPEFVIKLKDKLDGKKQEFTDLEQNIKQLQSGQRKREKNLQNIGFGRAGLNEKDDSMQAKIDSMREELNLVEEKTSTAEKAIERITSLIETRKGQLTELESRKATIVARASKYDIVDDNGRSERKRIANEEKYAKMVKRLNMLTRQIEQNQYKKVLLEKTEIFNALNHQKTQYQDLIQLKSEEIESSRAVVYDLMSKSSLRSSKVGGLKTFGATHSGGQSHRRQQRKENHSSEGQKRTQKVKKVDSHQSRKQETPSDSRASKRTGNYFGGDTDEEDHDATPDRSAHMRNRRRMDDTFEEDDSDASHLKSKNGKKSEELEGQNGGEDATNGDRRRSGNQKEYQIKQRESRQSLVSENEKVREGSSSKASENGRTSKASIHKKESAQNLKEESETTVKKSETSTVNGDGGLPGEESEEDEGYVPTSGMKASSGTGRTSKQSMNGQKGAENGGAKKVTKKKEKEAKPAFLQDDDDLDEEELA